MFEDCGESYRKELIKEESKLEAVVDIKVGLEKYMKKLRYKAK